MSGVHVCLCVYVCVLCMLTYSRECAKRALADVTKFLNEGGQAAVSSLQILTCL